MFLLLSAYTVTIVTIIMPYKLVNLGFGTYPGAALLIPLFYMIINVIAELYGYRMAVFSMLTMAVMTVFFCSLVSFILLLPVDYVSVNIQSLYVKFFSSTWSILLIGIIGWLIGPIVNSYFLTSWKVAFRGKYFWVRSSTASYIGELVQAGFCTTAAFFSYLPTGSIKGILMFAVFYKLVANIVFSLFANILIYVLDGCTNRDEEEFLVKE